MPSAKPLIARANMLLPGGYAWLVTVALPAAARGASLGARLTAALALVALLAGPILSVQRPRAGRAVGIWGFVGSSVLTWLLLGNLVGIDRLEPLRAALGAVAWALFAFGWGSVRRVDAVPEDDPRAIAGEPLPARARLPRGAVAVFAVAVAAALLPLFLAWRVDRPLHALFAHAAAVVCAIALVDAGVRLAVARGSWKPVASDRARLGSAATPLAMVGVLIVAGLVASAVR